MKFVLPLFILAISCADSSFHRMHLTKNEKKVFPPKQIKTEQGSWASFLQNLQVIDAPVLDFRGKPVSDQHKHTGIIPFDVGKRDLQQCADAIMRLRAEYLFGQRRFNEIGFHFVSGQYYSFNEYCNGKRVQAAGNRVKFTQTTGSAKTHEALRKYLDIVYSYASTISLAKELKKASDFEIGTIVIYPGSPGHCFIIIDESTNAEGKKVFKLAEGYTPAQSIYVLRNNTMSGKSPWHELKKGVIETASYVFTNYQLGKFE